MRRLRADHKLFLSYIALTAAVVLALTLGVGFTLRGQLTNLVAADLQRELMLARALYEASPRPTPDALADRLARLTGRRATVVGPNGEVLGDSNFDGAALAALENHAARPEIMAARAGRVGRDLRRSASLGVRHLYLAAPLGPSGVIRLAVPLSAVDRTVARVQRRILVGGALALAFAALLAFAFSMAVTRPLRRVAVVARAMAGGDLSRRIHAGDRDELGELTTALDTLADELQRRLSQLEGERAEMQALIDAMAEGVLAVGPGGELRRANPAARRIFNLPERARGLLPHEVARRPAFLHLVQQALTGEAVPALDFVQDERQLLATAQPLANGGAVLVFLDVTELRRLEGVRRDFVANASHELKTPLTAIRGFSETLLDEALPPALRRQFAQTLHANAERLQCIVDDLLDLSRLESGGWRAEPEIVSLEQTARDAWTLCRARAGDVDVHFAMNTAPGCEFVLADPSALEQVFSNLFSNALRYTPASGTVTVHSRCVAGERKPWIEVAVQDTGAGIPAVHLPRIFERFYRADAARSRAEGGTGLGLAIVRYLVEAHGGRVVAESQLSVGTTIRFCLPAAVPDPEEEVVTES